MLHAAWSRLAVLAALAACHGETGLLIEVVPMGSTTTAVELFLVERTCETCTTGMGLPGATAKTLGPVWLVDSSTRLWKQLDTSGLARFVVERGELDVLPRIIAVGIDAAGQPTGFAQVLDVAVPVTSQSYWRIPLGGTTGDAATHGLAAGDRVKLWGQPPDESGSGAASEHTSCLAILHGDGSGDFFGAMDDPDCDRITDPTLECDPTWYQHVDPTPMLACFPQKEAGVACELGRATACADGVGLGGCTGAPLCVPDAVCASCNGNLDPLCVDTVLKHLSTTRLACRIPLQQTGAGGFTPCTGSGSTGPITALSTLVSGPCTEPGFVTQVFPPPPASSATLTVAQPSPFSAALGVTALNGSTCEFTLGVDQSSTFGALTPVSAAFAIKSHNGAAEMLLPIDISFGTSCTIAVSCTVTSADDLWSCAP
jgi:hypothetical protein